MSEQSQPGIGRYFDKLAQGYGSGEYFTRRRDAVILAIREQVANAHSILDLGCGNGRFLAEFGSINPEARLTGADLSPEMLTETARRVSRANLVRADVSMPPFRGRSFDLIFASHVLQFLGNPGDSISRIAALLHPQGLFIATVGGGMRGAMSMRAVLGAAAWDKLSELLMGTRMEPRDQNLYREAFVHAGLECELKRPQFEVTFAGMLEWFRIRWLPVVSAERGDRAMQILSGLAERLSDRRLKLEERLLLAHRTKGV